jgi:copper chaperone
MKTKYEFEANGMSCGSCVRAITNAMKDFDPNAEVTVNLKDKLILVESVKSQKELSHIIEEEGYQIINTKNLGENS